MKAKFPASRQHPPLSFRRRRGIRQGAFVFLLAFLLVPLLGILAVANNAEPAIAGAAAVLCIMGGLLRIVYALMFESNLPGQATIEENILAGSRKYIKKKRAGKELPAGDPTPANVYAAPPGGTWRDTSELGTPSSVTDSTTKLLVKEQDDQ